jgi:predicted CXXCH cytochrome family protein
MFLEKHFNRAAFLTAVIAGSVAATGAVAQQQGPGPFATGIVTTKHNLSSTGTGINKSNETEICVFCHTPHGANTQAQAPLWNKATNTGTYTTYADTGSGSLDGGILAVGSVSLACLSCHDGTQALDTVINAPGSGGFNAAGARIPGVTWTGANVDPTTGRLTATAVTNLGTDLSNDHPVGIVYGGYNPGTGVIDPDFIAPTKHQTLNRWWVTTQGNNPATRSKSDLALYTRSGTAANNGVTYTNAPFVECASCHDPHSTNPLFLRVDNTKGSAVCLSCHTK